MRAVSARLGSPKLLHLFSPIFIANTMATPHIIETTRHLLDVIQSAKGGRERESATVRLRRCPYYYPAPPTQESKTQAVCKSCLSAGVSTGALLSYHCRPFFKKDPTGGRKNQAPHKRKSSYTQSWHTPKQKTSHHDHQAD